MAAMLAVPRKRTGRLDIGAALSGWLRANHGPHITESAGAAFAAGESGRLRDFVAEPLAPADEVQLKLLRYYRFLAALEQAVPVGPERRGVPLTFGWTEAFSDQRAERSAVAFEKAAVLFNIGATLSADAAAADLRTDVGCKCAARRFQEAAGVFDYLHTNVPLRLDFQGLLDLGPDATAAMAAVCLAQAQEATYVKAASDGKSAALLGRIARQAENMYTEARRKLEPESAPLAKALGRPMAAHLAAKAQLFGGVAWSHAAAVAEADDQCGTSVACWQQAQQQLEAAKREAGSAKVDPALPTRIVEQLTAAAAALATARRHNDAVYLQRIPKPEDLSRPEPVALVKPAPLPSDLEAVDDEWFAFLRTPAPVPLPTKGPGGLLGAIGRILR